MSDMTAEIGIGQWAEDMIDGIRRFADHWNEQREAGNPDYPETMLAGDWDEQFALAEQERKDGET